MSLSSDNGARCRVGYRKTLLSLPAWRPSSVPPGTGLLVPRGKTGLATAPDVLRMLSGWCKEPIFPESSTQLTALILPLAGSEKKQNEKKRLQHSSEGSNYNSGCLSLRC